MYLNPSVKLGIKVLQTLVGTWTLPDHVITRKDGVRVFTYSAIVLPEPEPSSGLRTCAIKCADGKWRVWITTVELKSCPIMSDDFDRRLVDFEPQVTGVRIHSYSALPEGAKESLISMLQSMLDQRTSERKAAGYTTWR